MSSTVKKVTKKYTEPSENTSDFDIDFQGEYDEIDGNLIMAENLPYCCGITEIGNFPPDKVYENIQYQTKKNYDNFAKYLDHIIDNSTYIINSNGKGFCKFIEAFMATKQGQSMFTLVKTFVNRSSKNTIKMYISNNI